MSRRKKERPENTVTKGKKSIISWEERERERDGKENFSVIMREGKNGMESKRTSNTIQKRKSVCVSNKLNYGLQGGKRKMSMTLTL